MPPNSDLRNKYHLINDQITVCRVFMQIAFFESYMIAEQWSCLLVMPSNSVLRNKYHLINDQVFMQIAFFESYACKTVDLSPCHATQFCFTE